MVESSVLFVIMYNLYNAFLFIYASFRFVTAHHVEYYSFSV